MPYQQKNKIYFHVSLDPCRAELLAQDARLNHTRPAAWIRELIYRHLAENSSVTEHYEEARELDDAAWMDTYRQRSEKQKASASSPE